MTLQRLYTFSAERNDAASFATFPASSTQPTRAAAAARTGGFGYRCETDTNPFGVVLPLPSSGVRIGYWLKHQGLSDLNAHIWLYYAFLTASVNDPSVAYIGIELAAEEGLLRVRRRNTPAAENEPDTSGIAIPAALMRENVWMHIGIVHDNLFRDSLEGAGDRGALHLYVDGVRIFEAASWLGDYGEDPEPPPPHRQVFHGFMDAVYIAGSITGGEGGWNQYAFVDDIYIDRYDGEVEEDGGGGAEVPPPAYRFTHAVPDQHGDFEEWTVTGAAQHWQAVDDDPPDGDATYVASDTLDQRDSYSVSLGAPPNGYAPVAAVAYAFARATAGNPSLAMLASDGVDESEADAARVPISYDLPITGVIEVSPNGDEWVAADIGPTEFGFRNAETPL